MKRVFGILNIPCQRHGRTQNHIVVEAEVAMIGMDQAAQPVRMDSGL
jgi:hypothetical protein